MEVNVSFVVSQLNTNVKCNIRTENGFKHAEWMNNIFMVSQIYISNFEFYSYLDFRFDEFA